MKKCIKLFFICFSTFNAFSQSIAKQLDFIIVIDEKIATNSIYSFEIKATTYLGNRDIESNYFPGNISMSQDDFNFLLSDSVNKFYFLFTYYEYINKKQIAYTYEIEIKKPWLKDNFNIIYIYNLNKEKYKKKYNPISKGKNYNYELDSPSNTYKLLKNYSGK